MIEIIDGDLFQWDIGRKIKVTPKDDFTVDEIHFCNIKSDTALIYRVYHDGEIVVNIPNILLQSDEDLIIYLVQIDDDFQQTFRRRIFKVHGRAKPSDYVYTDDEVFTYKTLLQEIEKIKNYTVDESKIKKAVDEYLSENPVEVPEVEIPENVSAFKNDAGYLTKDDIPEMPEIPDVPVQSVNGQTGDVKLDAESVGALPKDTKIPANTSDLSNDSGFITKAVNDLANYYLKSETYTQEEIKQLVSSIPKFSIQPVDSLPTTDISATTVYLLKSGDETDNLYTEYIYVDGAWEYLGNQTVDLSGYALSTDIPTNLSELVNDVGFITNTVSNLVNYYKKDEVYNRDEIDGKGFLTEHQDLSSYAKRDELPTKTSQLENDSNYLSQETDPTVPSWAKQSTKPSYTADEVGADSAGTAKTKVDEHNVNVESHNDIRLLIEGLTSRLNALADSDDTTLDQLSEVVAYIKSNRDLIDAVTTNKISYSDIVDNLTTNVSNKPLSAAQGVVLKSLFDSIKVPTKVSELDNDKGYLTEHQDISGKLDADRLPEAINSALSQAKASGEFDGVKGDKGDKPEKGVDYFTDSDKAEMVQAVISALPVYAGEVELV